MFRATAHLAVRICLACNIHPDAISYSSIFVSALAAICFWRAAVHPWLLIVGPILCYVRLWLNMLDGMVALAAKKASRRGEVLNDLPDRISDVLVFTGVAHSGLCAMQSGYLAAIFALLTAYVGTLGQAVGAKRQYGGAMSKPRRMLMLHVGSWTTLSLLWWGRGQIRWGSLTVLDLTCIAIVAGCIQTIFVRLKMILSYLATN